MMKRQNKKAENNEDLWYWTIDPRGLRVFLSLQNPSVAKAVELRLVDELDFTAMNAVDVMLQSGLSMEEWNAGGGYTMIQEIVAS